MNNLFPPHNSLKHRVDFLLNPEKTAENIQKSPSAPLEIIFDTPVTPSNFLNKPKNSFQWHVNENLSKENPTPHKAAPAKRPRTWFDGLERKKTPINWAPENPIQWHSNEENGVKSTNNQKTAPAKRPKKWTDVSEKNKNPCEWTLKTEIELESIYETCKKDGANCIEAFLKEHPHFTPESIRKKLLSLLAEKTVNKNNWTSELEQELKEMIVKYPEVKTCTTEFYKKHKETFTVCAIFKKIYKMKNQ